MRLSYDNYNSKRALSSHTHVHTFYKNNAQQESRLSLAVVPTVHSYHLCHIYTQDRKILHQNTDGAEMLLMVYKVS